MPYRGRRYGSSSSKPKKTLNYIRRRCSFMWMMGIVALYHLAGDKFDPAEIGITSKSKFRGQWEPLIRVTNDGVRVHCMAWALAAMQGNWSMMESASSAIYRYVRGRTELQPRYSAPKWNRKGENNSHGGKGAEANAFPKSVADWKPCLMVPRAYGEEVYYGRYTSIDWDKLKTVRAWTPPWSKRVSVYVDDGKRFRRYLKDNVIPMPPFQLPDMPGMPSPGEGKPKPGEGQPSESPEEQEKREQERKEWEREQEERGEQDWDEDYDDEEGEDEGRGEDEGEEKGRKPVPEGEEPRPGDEEEGDEEREERRRKARERVEERREWAKKGQEAAKGHIYKEGEIAWTRARKKIRITFASPPNEEGKQRLRWVEIDDEESAV
jgi:hypothetical protein